MRFWQNTSTPKRYLIFLNQGTYSLPIHVYHCPCKVLTLVMAKAILFKLFYFHRPENIIDFFTERNVEMYTFR